MTTLNNMHDTVTGTIFDSRRFTYVKHTKCFVADISEVREALRELWSDSMDLGFGIRSYKTNRVVFFILKNILRSADGEINGWIFEVHNPSDHPDLRGLAATIYND